MMWFAFGFVVGAVISHILTYSQLSAENDRLVAALEAQKTSRETLRDALTESETKPRT